MTITLNGTSGITAPTYAGTVTAEYSVPVTAFKNRIINGAMVIDQRNAGASVSAVSGSYYLDRWRCELTGGGAYTIQRSSVAPAGFVNSALVTVTTADSSIASTDYYDMQQFIEGLNVSDFGWGTASATSITISFWVRSSLTGTFGGSVSNSDGSRSYVFTYNINAANTWEQKTATIPGDTSGTWLTTNGRGLALTFDFGNGSNYQAAANTWLSQYAVGTTSSVKLISTVGATWQLTGVQLEKGSTATSFDYRPYGTELALCQRYYYRIVSGNAGQIFGSSYNSTTSTALVTTPFPVTLRTNPTAIEQSGTAGDYRVNNLNTATTCTSVPAFNTASQYNAFTTFTTGATLTAGQASAGSCVNTNAYLGWNAEL